MLKMNKILLIFLFAGISITAHSEEWSGVFSSSSVEQHAQTMDIDVLINSQSKVSMYGIPTSGYLEVYSILGVRVRTVNLRNCVGGYSLDLPKGIYILRAGRVAVKVVAK